MSKIGPNPGRVRVSVVIPSRDEAHNVERVLAVLAAQTRQPDEVVVADGLSTDGSREMWMAADSPELPVRVVDNPERIVPAALNVALEAATGDVIARMDTHADYAPDYLEQVVGVLERRPDVVAVGGSMDTQGRGTWGRAIASTLRRPFGLGGARHRVGGGAGPIQHVFSGCYRREVVVRTGGWDERFHANEDFEADLRVAEEGTVWLEPAATSVWYVRRTPRALALQMWRYGYFKGLTLHVHPDSVRMRQLVPPALVLGLAGTLVVWPLVGVVLTGAYLSAAGVLGARAALSDGADPVRGAVVPPVVHLSWGAGLVAGWVRFLPERRRHLRAPVREADDAVP